MKLYKYCSASRIENLQSRKIRFTQAIEFNDPFDLAPTYDMLSKEDQEAFAQEDTASGGDGKSFNLTPKRWHQIVSATKLGQEFLLRKYSWLEGQYALDNNLVAHLQLSLTFGVLSLSEVHDNLLMWSHYGDQHRGFVIEFDTSSSFFRTNFAETLPGRLLKVDYNEVRPHLSSSTLGRPEALTRKAPDWAYEREWRMIKYLCRADDVRPIHGPNEIPSKDALPLHLFSFPEISVSAVFTGARMRAEDYEQLTQLVSSDKGYSHVRMHHMQLSAVEYRLITTPPLPGSERDPELNWQTSSARPLRV